MMWDLKCIAAALCFLVSNILFIVHGVLAMYGSQNSQMANANDSNIDQGVYDSDNNYPGNKDAVQSMAKPTSWNYEYWTDLGEFSYLFSMMRVFILSYDVVLCTHHFLFGLISI